ncbi:MAG: D-alanyl-D-alanine carboxypeptidase, partial [Clostridia bacterium]|nr:D-alanyl-D-alanine carboxypeptidase [Clostridia bacterium]
MVKKASLFLIILIFLSKDVFSMSARSSIAIDGESGRIFYANNINEKMGMASTTKIMTAIIALEQANLEDIVTVSENAANTEGSSMYLVSGEKIKMENLIYGLMLNSGNDAATAIAEHISKNTDNFAVLMNNKSREIGLKNTSFSNPHGLDNENHYSTAYDMAMLARYAMQNEKFREIVSTKVKTIEEYDNNNFKYLTNHNKLLKIYKYCSGIKTGFTKKCGRCLVSSAEKDGVKCIVVTLNDPDDWNDHINLYENVFSNYKSYKLADKNSFICSVNVKDSPENIIKLYSADDIFISLTNDEYKRIHVKYDYQKDVKIPIYKG